MKSGASESSYIFLQNHIEIPKHIHISHIPQDLYTSKKRIKILWAHHAYDQPHYLNFNYNAIDLIVCPSEWSKNQFIEYHKVPEEKLKVISNGVNQIFTPSKNKNKTFIHTSIPYKGLELLPYIFPKILKKHPDAKLKVFSSMSLYEIEQDSYESVYEKLKLISNVEYSSAVDQSELVAAYQESAFFIHPNIWEETFCVSMVESMSCGCYPIITDIGAIPEVSKGIATIVPIEGIRTPSKYEVTEAFLNKFAEACINACDIFEKERSYYDQISAKISSVVKECYDWKIISQKWKQVLEEFAMTEQKSLPTINFKEAIREDKNYIQQALENIFVWDESDKELAQSRSNFQLEKFFLLDQHTIPAAFHAALKERRTQAEQYMYKLIEMKSKKREFEYRWKDKDKSEPVETKTAEGGYRYRWYDLDEYELTCYLKSSDIEIRDRLQQLKFLDSILDTLVERNGGKLITREQFENEDHVYWERRFADQIFDEIVSRSTGISIGNLHSVRRATAPCLVTEDQNRIKNPYPDLNKALNPETRHEFCSELQQKIIAGIEEVTGANLNVFESSEEDLVELLPEKSESRKSFFNKESGLNFYREE